jgi:signal transduction histidine kinase
MFAALVAFADTNPLARRHALDQNPVIRFDHADYCAASSVEPPKDCWENVSLPDLWRIRIPLRREAGWYRFNANIDGWNTSQVGLYLPRFEPNVRIWLEGAEIARSSQLEGELEHHHRMPFFVKLNPEKLVSPKLIVYVRADALITRSTSLGNVYIGDATKLYRSFYWRHFWQNDGQLAVTFMIGALGLMALIIWLGDVKDPIFLWYSVAAILWPVASAEPLSTSSPINRTLLVHIDSFILLVIAVAFAQFMLELSGRRKKFTDRALLVFALTGAICMPLLYEDRIPVRYTLLITVMTLMLGTLILWIVFDQYKKLRDGLSLGMVMACIVILILGVHDAISAWTVSLYMSSDFIIYGGFPLMGCMGGALLRRYNTAKFQAATTREQNANIARERERLRTIGHEIRSPLQSLLSLHGGDSDRSRRYVKRMQNAVETLFGSASPDQAFSSLQLELEDLDLSAFLAAYAAGAHATVGNILFPPSETALYARVDSARLEDVLDNLVSNADRFRLSATPIVIRSMRVNNEIEIQVENQGPHIDISRLDAIFEYGESSEKEYNGHQGLGLFVVKTHISKMGGRVFAQNTLDGVKFIIALPLAMEK